MPMRTKLIMKATQAQVSVEEKSLRLRANCVKRMNTKSRSQLERLMCQRFQKSLMSVAQKGARKLRGTSTPSA